MKKIFTLSFLTLLSFSAFSGTTKTTTTSTYEESSSAPVGASQMDSDESVMEAEEYDRPLSPEEVDETRRDEQQKMEERNQNSSTIIESEDAIDYSDRTRTNRERKALNTGSHASDDQ